MFKPICNQCMFKDLCDEELYSCDHYSPEEDDDAVIEERRSEFFEEWFSYWESNIE